MQLTKQFYVALIITADLLCLHTSVIQQWLYSYRLDLLRPESCLLPAAAAPMLTSWFYQTLPLFPIPSSLYCIGENQRYTCYGFSETWVIAKLAGTFLTQLFAWTVTQRAPKVFELVISVVIEQHVHFKINNWDVTLDNQTFLFVMAGLILEKLLCCPLFIYRCVLG